MAEFFEKNLSVVFLVIKSYFLFSTLNALNKYAKYESNIKKFTKKKSFSNDQDSSNLYQQEAVAIISFEVMFIGKY